MPLLTRSRVQKLLFAGGVVVLVALVAMPGFNNYPVDVKIKHLPGQSTARVAPSTDSPPPPVSEAASVDAGAQAGADSSPDSGGRPATSSGTPSSSSTEPEATTNPEVTAWEPVSINTATEEELQTVPHIGPKLAHLIVEARPPTGYLELIDLIKVHGIGESRYNQIKGYIKL